jgi:hypothetical protein
MAQIHLCHAVDCSERISPKLLMCPRHWYMVPPALRKRVWQTYRPGQEFDKCPSKAYLEVAKQAINFVAEKEGKPPLKDTAEVIKTLELMLSKTKRD